MSAPNPYAAAARALIVPIPRPISSIPNMEKSMHQRDYMINPPPIPIPPAPPVPPSAVPLMTANVNGQTTAIVPYIGAGGQCAICAEAPNSVALHCGHKSCNNCLRSWIDSKVVEGAGSDGQPPRIRCPFPDCKEHLSDAEIQTCLKLFPESLESYHKLSIIRALSNQPDFFPCPAPKCGGGGFWTDDLDCSPKGSTDNERRLDVAGPTNGEKRPPAFRVVRKGRVECPHCAASWSLSPELEQQARASRAKLFVRRVLSKLRCCRRFLPQTPAEYNAEQLLWSETNRLAADGSTDLFKSTFTQECPKCKVRILKEGGCSHMTCGKCRHSFTWTKKEAQALPVPPPPGSLASRYFPGPYMAWQRVDQRIKNAIGIVLALTLAITVLGTIAYLGTKLVTLYLLPYFSRTDVVTPTNVSIACGLIFRIITIVIAIRSRYRRSKPLSRITSTIDFTAIIFFWFEQPTFIHSPAFLAYVYSTFVLVGTAIAIFLVVKRRELMWTFWNAIPYKLRERLRAKGARPPGWLGASFSNLFID